MVLWTVRSTWVLLVRLYPLACSVHVCHRNAAMAQDYERSGCAGSQCSGFKTPGYCVLFDFKSLGTMPCMVRCIQYT